jgi:hypothetical protein
MKASAGITFYIVLCQSDLICMSAFAGKLRRLSEVVPEYFTPLLPRFLKLMSSASGMHEQWTIAMVFMEIAKRNPQVDYFDELLLGFLKVNEPPTQADRIERTMSQTANNYSNSETFYARNFVTISSSMPAIVDS